MCTFLSEGLVPKIECVHIPYLVCQVAYIHVVIEKVSPWYKAIQENVMSLLSVMLESAAAARAKMPTATNK